MVWQIALGILLGWLLIQSWHDLLNMADGILNAIFDFIGGIFHTIGKCWRWFRDSRWYVKLLIFIALTYFLGNNDMLNAWLCVLFVYIYFVASWIEKTIVRMSDKIKDYWHRKHK